MGNVIDFKRMKNIHFANYNEHIFFKEYKNFDSKKYNIKDVVEAIGIGLDYQLNDFPEQEDRNLFAIIEVKDQDNIKFHINNQSDKISYEYDTLNCCLAVTTDMLLPNISQYSGKYILIGEKEMLVKAFFKRHYRNCGDTVHKDIAFKINSGKVKNITNVFKKWF